MKLLIDTHVLLWMRREPARIPAGIASMLKSERNEVYLSAATAWEIATKARIGKLTVDPAFLDDFDRSVRALAFEPLAITSDHAVTGARLSGTHKDPFDRLLAGQALVEKLQLVSADPDFSRLGIEALWGG